MSTNVKTWTNNSTRLRLPWTILQWRSMIFLNFSNTIVVYPIFHSISWLLGRRVCHTMNCIFYCFFHNSLHPLECWSLPIQQLFLSTRTPIVDNANTCTQERKEKQRTKGMSIRLFMKFSTTKTQATQATQATETQPNPTPKLNPTEPNSTQPNYTNPQNTYHGA